MVATHYICAGAPWKKSRRAPIGCNDAGARLQHVSALIGAILTCVWARGRAFPPKGHGALLHDGARPSVGAGRATRKAHWSISLLPDAPRAVPAETAFLSRPSLLSASWRMLCSKTRSAPQADHSAVYLSRKPYPTKALVPHTPPVKGGCSFATALFHVDVVAHVWHTRGVRAVHNLCTSLSHNVKAGPC